MANNEHHELYENARKRVKQKKRLYFHFVLFLVGSIFLIVLNKVLNVGELILKDWFVWAIILWLFFWVLHFVNVFVTNKFMGKEWERIQTDKLVLKQELKIAKMEKAIAKEAQIKAESEQFAAEVKESENPQINKEN
ncbi:2TM domain-containing protein [Lutibacter oricola]|uniref:2TM domain-containing protein n=1 Tax=Lutibacter oricola TaxID=762486 RepID=A0A1H2TDR6_9FLAO|nr:2TM domain-containing protein [Lutibacter oricola]SDW42051.1 2TM domain-containing protein [Lutibacter oricola]